MKASDSHLSYFSRTSDSFAIIGGAPDFVNDNRFGDTNAICGTVKSFLRQLSEPVIPFGFFQSALATSSMSRRILTAISSHSFRYRCYRLRRTIGSIARDRQLTTCSQLLHSQKTYATL